MSITIKDAAGIEGMRVAGRLASELLDYLTPFVKPGVTTNEIDKLAHDYMVQVQGTIPATLGYQPPGYGPYPKSLCTSVNEVICHGIPDSTVVQEGDIVKVDITAFKDGVHGDNCGSFIAGEGSKQARQLVEVTREAMMRGIKAARPGRRWSGFPHRARDPPLRRFPVSLRRHRGRNGFHC